MDGAATASAQQTAGEQGREVTKPSEPNAPTPRDMPLGVFAFLAFLARVYVDFGQAPGALGFEGLRAGSGVNLQGCDRTPEFRYRTLGLSELTGASS